MANINTDDVLRVTAEMTTVDLSVVQNVYTTKITAVGALPVSDVLDRIVLIMELIYNIVKLLQNTRTKYSVVRFFNITQNIPLATRPWSTVTQGSLVVNDLAHMTAAMISLGVDLPGVSGRKFFGGIAELPLDEDGLWSVATVAQLASIGALMLLDHTIFGTTLKFGIMTGVVPAFVQFKSAQATNIPGTQRRRRQGRGI